MADVLRVVAAQLNFCVGDISTNCQMICEAALASAKRGVDCIIFPELALTGYPPEDLLIRPGLQRRVDLCLDEIAQASQEVTIVVGHPRTTEAGLFNSASVFASGECIARYDKQALPNYAVFDEKRYFEPGEGPVVTTIGGFQIGLSICEDIWQIETSQANAKAGAEVIFNINASPYNRGKYEERLTALRAAAQAGGLPIVYTNIIGGQDELVFDGSSLALNADGAVAARAPQFAETLFDLEISRTDTGISLHGDSTGEKSELASIYQALVTGVRDYIDKNRFKGCVLGLSGGIDSALTLAVAVDAIGAENVVAVSMPSRYTAQMSIDDALAQARSEGCQCHVVSIEEPFSAFTQIIEPVVADLKAGAAQENMQARCRGLILMALSNAEGKIVLATGNKSEMSVGYATLYGDMAGGFAPLKDIPKMLVYELANYRNTISQVIPNRVIERPPSAELAPDQKDTDSLPPYEILDPILERYIERDMTPREIANEGFDLETAKRVAGMVDRNEYKRRQAAPGVKITRRAFGRDRRFPITSRYSEQQPVLK
ncbi:MAG: NAD+ synthase [Pseudomonadota bacterium]